MNLIRTGLRDKLSQGLAYPVGAETISATLAGVPQFDGLWIAFNRHAWPALYHLAPAAPATDFKVLLIAVFNQRPQGSTFDNSWYISVHAVPQEFRTQAREALARIGLPGLNCYL